MTIETDRDFDKLRELAVPVKRAAYSDRTAWIMAVLAEIAYTPLDEESDHELINLAGELAALANQEEIVERLRELRKTLAALNPAAGDQDTQNEKLKAALKAGGFELAGGRPLHDAATPRVSLRCDRGMRRASAWR
jgi:triacylglycerol lipase